MRRVPTKRGKRPSPGTDKADVEIALATATEHQAREWLTDSDVNASYQIATGTLRYWRSVGLGPPYHRLAERTVLYRRSDIEAWLAKRIVRPEAREGTTGEEGSPT